MATSGRQATSAGRCMVAVWTACSLREEANEEAGKASESKDHDGCEVAILVCLGVLVHVLCERW